MSNPARLGVIFCLLSASAGCRSTGVGAMPASPTTPTVHGTTQPLHSAKLTASTAKLFRAAVAVRRLSLLRAVPVNVQNHQQISRYLLQQAEEDQLAQAKSLYSALGLLPPDIDIRALLQRVLGEQVVGYYDSDTNALAVRDDLLANGLALEAETVLVHEIVHALQDQHLQLDALVSPQRDSDAQNALHALIEGDATLAMLGYVAQRNGISLEQLTRSPALLAALPSTSAAPAAAELDAAPAIVRVTLLAAYLRGLAFVAELHRRGGWQAVDRAYRHPPVSSEQVLHPEKFFAEEKPAAIVLPPLPLWQHAGYFPLKEDTLGELELSVYFGQRSPSGVDELAAAGWSGDRLRAYRHPKRPTAVVWFTVWDNDLEAEQAYLAAERVLDHLASRDLALQRVERLGRAVLILRWVTPELQASARSSFAAFAAGLPPPRLSGR